MQRYIVVLTLIFGVFVTSLTASQAQTSEKLRLTMMAIGADAWIESFAESMRRSENPAAGEPDLGWRQAAEEIFIHEDIFADLMERMNGRMDESELDEILAFLATDIGRTVTKMEIDAQNPDIAAGVDMAGAQIVEDLKANDPDRLAAYRDMLKAVDGVDSGVATAMNMNFALLSGMAANGGGNVQMSEGEILSLLASQEPMIRESVERSSLENAAFTYRDLSDADFDVYVGFLTSPAGKKLYSVMNTTADDIMAERGRAFGARIIELQGLQEL